MEKRKFKKLAAMLKRIVFLSFVFSLYTIKIINAQENEGSKQFIYKGDTINIKAISLYDIPDEIEHDKTSIQNLRLCPGTRFSNILN